jgi:hypothetical protein
MMPFLVFDQVNQSVLFLDRQFGQFLTLAWTADAVTRIRKIRGTVRRTDQV